MQITNLYFPLFKCLSSRVHILRRYPDLVPCLYQDFICMLFHIQRFPVSCHRLHVTSVQQTEGINTVLLRSACYHYLASVYHTV